MKYVTLGRTGARVSRIGMGGFPLGAVNEARAWNPYSPKGHAVACRVVRCALDHGINYLDTAEGYGNGHSESVIGEAIRGRNREGLFIATKFGMCKRPSQIEQSVHASLERLGCGYLDLIQFHGGAYGEQTTHAILDGGAMETLERLRAQGLVRFIGATSEEPWSLLPLLRSNRLDVVQVRYNLIYQCAAHHLLNEARDMNVGVVLMRPMTSGMLPMIAQNLLPELEAGCNLYEICLKYVLADSRVHTAHVGMRWPHEVEQNCRLVDSWDPTFDVADLPRSTAGVYEAQDRHVGD